MAEQSSSASPETGTTTVAAESAVTESGSIQPVTDNLKQYKLPTPLPPPPPPPAPSAEPQLQPSTTLFPNPNPSAQPPTSLIPPPSIQSYGAAVPPSYRPAPPQFSPLPPNPNLPVPQPPTYQAPGGVPPPGVSSLPQPPMLMQPPPVSGAGQIPGQPFAMLGQPLRPGYISMPNGYPAIHQPGPQGTIPPGGFLIPLYIFVL